MKVVENLKKVEVPVESVTITFSPDELYFVRNVVYCYATTPNLDRAVAWTAPAATRFRQQTAEIGKWSPETCFLDSSGTDKSK